MRKTIFKTVIFSTLLLTAGCGAEHRYKKAEKFENNSNFKAAIEGYHKVMKKYPDTEYAREACYRAAGISYENLDDPDSALKLYKQFVKIYTDDERVYTAMFMIAEIYFKDKQFKNSGELYKKIVDSSKNDPLSKKSAERLAQINLLDKELAALIEKTIRLINKIKLETALSLCQNMKVKLPESELLKKTLSEVEKKIDSRNKSIALEVAKTRYETNIIENTEKKLREKQFKKYMDGAMNDPENILKMPGKHFDHIKWSAVKKKDYIYSVTAEVFITEKQEKERKMLSGITLHDSREHLSRYSSMTYNVDVSRYVRF
ncbi:MAG: tetratricopeptide repeat protein [Elusimicrobiota bacterium]